MKILDSSGVINARDKVLDGDFLTVPEVKAELRDIQSRMKFEAAVAQGKVHFEEPSAKSIKTIRAEAEKNGVLALLSVPDIAILSLAYEKKLPIVTDDYDIQNVCMLMGLKFETIITRGIKEPFSWKKKCTACKKEYAKDILECEACGSTSFSALKR